MLDRKRLALPHSCARTSIPGAAVRVTRSTVRSRMHRDGMPPPHGGTRRATRSTGRSSIHRDRAPFARWHATSCKLDSPGRRANNEWFRAVAELREMLQQTNAALTVARSNAALTVARSRPSSQRTVSLADRLPRCASYGARFARKTLMMFMFKRRLQPKTRLKPLKTLKRAAKALVLAGLERQHVSDFS